MPLCINGTPLVKAYYNGLEITDESIKVDELDFSDWDNGYFEETLADGTTSSFTIDFDGSGRPVKFTDGSGHETVVTWS